MRMQPCEARLPIDHSCDGPVDADAAGDPHPARPQRVRGAPPASSCPASSPAHGEFGAVQAGLTCLLGIEKRPVGVG